ncbi:MAG: ArsR/SmtB family transcription factor [Pseudomonadota bacterium]
MSRRAVAKQDHLRAIPPWDCRISPRFELFLALWSLTSDRARRHPDWRRRMRRALPGTFWAAEAALGGAPEIWLLAAAAPGAALLDASPADLVTAIERQPPEALLAHLLSGLLRDAALARRVASGALPLVRALSALPRPRALAIRSIGIELDDPEAPLARAWERLLTDPAGGQRALAAGLDAFREAVFEPLWRRLRAELEASAARARQQIAGGDWGGLGHRLGLAVEFDPKARTVRHLAGGERLALAELDSLHFLPSAFNEAGLWLAFPVDGRTQGRPMAACFPFLDPSVGPEPQRSVDRADGPVAMASAPERGAAAPATEAVDVALAFRALGDATRFAMASLLGRRAMPAVELARQLGLSKPTVTHHLHRLREAGLIEARMQGGRPLLALKREAIEALSDRAVERLFEREAGLPRIRSRRR